MKREKLMKVFPYLGEWELQNLPQDLIVCWYPSSNNHFDAAFDWQRQATKLQPDLFIYTDIMDFEIPPEAEVFFSSTIDGADIKRKFTEQPNEEKNNWDKIRLKGLDHISFNDSHSKESEYFNGVLRLILMKFKEKWYFLVTVENEYFYLLLLENKAKIDCLYVNRPCDSFLSDRGPNPNQKHFIDIKKIGVKIFISGKNNGIRPSFNKEYKKISTLDIKFEPYESDPGEIYSRIG